MSFNGTNLTTDPFNEIFSTFTDILSSAFWLIPIGFIAVALYVKTKNITAMSVWLVVSCLVMGSGNIYGDHPAMGFVYYLFAVVGMVGTVVSVYLMRK